MLQFLLFGDGLQRLVVPTCVFLLTLPFDYLYFLLIVCDLNNVQISFKFNLIQNTYNSEYKLMKYFVVTDLT